MFYKAIDSTFKEHWHLGMETRGWRAPEQEPATGRHTGKQALEQYPCKLLLIKKRR